MKKPINYLFLTADKFSPKDQKKLAQEMDYFFNKYELQKEKGDNLFIKLHQIANINNNYPEEDSNYSRKLLRVYISNQVNTKGLINTDTEEIQMFASKYLYEFLNSKQKLIMKLIEIAEPLSDYPDNDKRLAQSLLKKGIVS